MNCWDKLVSSHKQVMLIEAQKIEMMKMHLAAIKECSEEDNLMAFAYAAYTQMIENEKTLYESMKRTLEKYETAKNIHEE